MIVLAFPKSEEHERRLNYGVGVNEVTQRLPCLVCRDVPCPSSTQDFSDNLAVCRGNMTFKSQCVTTGSIRLYYAPLETGDPRARARHGKQSVDHSIIPGPVHEHVCTRICTNDSRASHRMIVPFNSIPCKPTPCILRLKTLGWQGNASMEGQITQKFPCIICCNRGENALCMEETL